MRPSLLVLAAALAACGDQRPCTSCPAIGGAYLVSWQNGLPQENCPQTGPRPVNLNFVQEGNRLSVLVGGEELRGTLFDTYDFSVSGGRTQVSYSLTGRAVVNPATTTADGGSSAGSVRLVGNLSSRSVSGQPSCDLAERFTADRL